MTKKDASKEVETVSMTNVAYLEFLYKVKNAGETLLKNRQAEIEAWANDAEAVTKVITDALKSKLYSDGITLIQTQKYWEKYGPEVPWWGFGYVKRVLNRGKLYDMNTRIDYNDAVTAALKGKTIEEAVQEYIKAHGGSLVEVYKSFYNYGNPHELINEYREILHKMPNVPEIIRAVEASNDATYTIAFSTYKMYTDLIDKASK